MFRRLALLALVVAACGCAAGPSIEQLEARWRELAGFDPPADVQFPNSAALDLEIAAAALGIELAPQGAEGRPRVEAARAEQAHSRIAAAYEALDGIRVREPHLEPLGAEIQEFMDAFTEPLARVEAILVDGEAPQWEESGSAPLPNLPGHIRLHRLLVIAAVERMNAGDTNGCFRALEAAATVRDAFPGQDGTSELYADIALTIELSVARALPHGSERALSLLPPVDRLLRMERAIRLSGWSALQMLRRDESGLPRRGLPGWYWGIGVRRALEIDDLMIRRFREAPPGGHDPVEFEKEIQRLVPRWNSVAGLFSSRQSDLLFRAARCDLDLELTRWQLEMRSLVERGEQRTARALCTDRPSSTVGHRLECSLQSDIASLRIVPTPRFAPRHPLPLDLAVGL